MRRLLAGALVVGLAAAVWFLVSRSAADAPATRAVWVYVDESPSTPAARDAPIARTMVDAIERTGARLRHESRWLRAVSVDADDAVLDRIGALPFVRRVTPVARLETARAWAEGAVAPAPPDAVPAAVRRQAPDSAFYGVNWPAIRALGFPAAQSFGYRGENVRIAILDTGFDPRHEAFIGRRVIGSRDFINGDSIVYNEANDPLGADRHGTQVWSLIGGFRPGTLVGPAYDAQFILAKVDDEPGDTRADEDRWVAAVEWADSLNAHIIHTSVVFRAFLDRPSIQYAELNGDSTVVTRIADEAARRGILVISAIGNEGPAAGSLSAPADGDSVLAVGAIDETGAPASFASGASARGPTADGRIKPDVVARGTGLTAAIPGSLAGYQFSLSGTSYSAALVTSGAALVRQAWPQLSAHAILNAVRLSGNRLGSPDNALGFGVPDIAAAILFPDGLVPTNVATVDLQGAVTTIAPTLNWRATLVNPLMRPVTYRLQIASDSLFTNIVYTDTVRDAFSVTTTRALKPLARAHWRVLATGQAGIRATSVPGQPFIVPRWVRLISPDGDQVQFVDSPRPELTWAPLTAPAPIGPLVYDVEILSNETGQLVQPTMRNVTTSTVRVAQPLVPNTAYRWRVIARTQLGVADTAESVAPFVVTSAEEPPATLLYQNFPNPFPRFDLGALETRIWFDLAEASVVRLTVLDLRGRIVRRLIPADASCAPVTLQPGIYGRGSNIADDDPCIQTRWDGEDGEGRVMPRGVYILQLVAGGKVETRRMLFLPEG